MVIGLTLGYVFGQKGYELDIITISDEKSIPELMGPRKVSTMERRFNVYGKKEVIVITIQNLNGDWLRGENR